MKAAIAASQSPVGRFSGFNVSPEASPSAEKERRRRENLNERGRGRGPDAGAGEMGYKDITSDPAGHKACMRARTGSEWVGEDDGRGAGGPGLGAQAARRTAGRRRQCRVSPGRRRSLRPGPIDRGRRRRGPRAGRAV